MVVWVALCIDLQVLRQKLHRSFKNVRIVSNRMVFNLSGQLVSFKGIFVHLMTELFLPAIFT